MRTDLQWHLFRLLQIRRGKFFRIPLSPPSAYPEKPFKAASSYNRFCQLILPTLLCLYKHGSVQPGGNQCPRLPLTA